MSAGTWLSFNSQHVGQVASLPALPAEETEEDEAILRAPIPLSYTWVLWEQLVPSDSKNPNAYSDATHKVAPFNTVQEFWRIWNGLPQPSELLEQKRITREQSSGSTVPIDALMIFKEGITPEWEHPLNATGGHFQIQLKPLTGSGQIDEYWNNVVLGMIGGTIEPAEIITGIRLVDKLSGPKAAGVIRIELWFSKYEDTAAVTQLRKSMERCMQTRLDGSMGQLPKTETKGHTSMKH